MIRIPKDCRRQDAPDGTTLWSWIINRDRLRRTCQYCGSPSGIPVWLDPAEQPPESQSLPALLHGRGRPALTGQKRIRTVVCVDCEAAGMPPKKEAGDDDLP